LSSTEVLVNVDEVDHEKQDERNSK